MCRRRLSPRPWEGAILGSITLIDDCCWCVRSGGGEDVRHQVFGLIGGVRIEKAWVLLVADYEEQKGEERELHSTKW